MSESWSLEWQSQDAGVVELFKQKLGGDYFNHGGLLRVTTVAGIEELQDGDWLVVEQGRRRVLRASTPARTDVFGRSVDDWPNQVIRCKHCGLPLNRIDLPAPEGPDRKGMHGWIHHGVSGPGSAVFCPSRTLGGPSLGVAEPSDYVKTLFDRAIQAARAAAPKPPR
jgi:hypothetical protein